MLDPSAGGKMQKSRARSALGTERNEDTHGVGEVDVRTFERPAQGQLPRYQKKDFAGLGWLEFLLSCDLDGPFRIGVYLHNSEHHARATSMNKFGEGVELKAGSPVPKYGELLNLLSLVEIAWEGQWDDRVLQQRPEIGCGRRSPGSGYIGRFGHGAGNKSSELNQNLSTINGLHPGWEVDTADEADR